MEDIAKLIEGGAVAVLGAAFLLTLRWMLTSFDRSLRRVEDTQQRLVNLLVVLEERLRHYSDEDN